MVPRKIWISLNVSLGIIAFILLFNLLWIGYPSLGEAYAQLLPGEAVIFVQSGLDFRECSSFERCCFEARTRLDHFWVSENIYDASVDHLFRTSKDGIQYWMNAKAYHTCRQLPFW